MGEQISVWVVIVAFAGGYLCGSIPFGLLFTRLAGMGDVRNIGSGNIGATNVLRTGSKTVAIATLLGDVAKGTLPVLTAVFIGGPILGLIAGLGAIAGHILPVWLGFKGGKGVATYLGILFGLYWPLGLAFIAIWLIIAGIFRISSLSALLTVLVMVIVAFILGKTIIAWGLIGLAVVIYITHRENIGRLLAGSETKIKLK